jgi:hypothetical protein
VVSSFLFCFLVKSEQFVLPYAFTIAIWTLDQMPKTMGGSTYLGQEPPDCELINLFFF